MVISKVIENYIKEAVSSLWDVGDIEISVEHPDRSEHGDYSSNIALKLGKVIQEDPMKIAQDIVDEITSKDLFFDFSDHHYPIFSDISCAPPGFINFRLSVEWLKSEVLKILNESETFGSSDIGKGEKIIVEFSQMNTNKPQHVGHARNNFLGSSISNILDFVGYEVIKSVYAGDIGAHEAKSILMYQLYGNNQEPNKKPDHFVGDFYSMYESKVAEDPSLEGKAKEVLRKWESSDPEIIDIWEKMNKWVYEGWEQTYKDQNITYDIRERESDHIETGKEIAEMAVEKGLAERDSTGAVVAHLENYELPDKVLIRSDGTSLYITKDLQLAKDSYEKYQFAKRLYVVDYRQSDYFRQLFKLLEIFGFNWYNRLEHIAYGTVVLPDGGMSSRKGNIISADEVYSKLVELEEEELMKSSKEIRHPEETIRDVALSAFRYALLKVDAGQNIVFNYEIATKFEGNTGPYILYTYARANSVLEKSGLKYDNLDVSVIEDFGLITPTEKELIILRTLHTFPEIVEKSAKLLEPHHIAGYVFDLASKFNTFYAECPILDAPDEYTKRLRIAITITTSIVIKQCMRLLVINVVEKM